MTARAEHPLRSAFQLLDRIELEGSLRALMALCLRLDTWLAHDEPVRPAAAAALAPSGHLVNEGVRQSLWLVPEARLLVVPHADDEPPRLVPLDESALPPAVLAGMLRPVLLRAHLGGPALTELEGAAVPRIVNELLVVARGAESPSRAFVLRALAGALRDAPGWRDAATRLQAAFEQATGDRAAGVRAVGAAALVRMATGGCPRAPTADPARMLAVLFAATRGDVHVATLAALSEAPQEALEELSEGLRPRIEELRAHADPEARRLATELDLRLGVRPAAWTLARRLTAADPGERIAALEALAETGHEERDALLPQVLDAAEAEAPEVRRAALGVIGPVLGRRDDPLSRRILLSLLGGRHPEGIEVALDHLGERPDAIDDEVAAALTAALDGPRATRAAVVERLAAHYRDLPPEAAADAYAALVHHGDPEIRHAGLEGLARQARDRRGVVDRLVTLLAETMRHPDPETRLAAARTVVALGVPNAGGIVLQLVVDPLRVVRHGALTAIHEAGDDALTARAAAALREADALFDLRASDSPDGRMRWLGALRALCAEQLTRVTELLLALLREIPADTPSPFLRFALAEIDRRIIERSPGADLVVLCRHLLEPPAPRPEHAARLAGSIAAREPEALDFLWTLYVAASGAAANAARRELAALTGAEKSDAVEDELRALLERTDDPAQRDVLHTLLAAPGPGGGAG